MPAKDPDPLTISASNQGMKMAILDALLVNGPSLETAESVVRQMQTALQYGHYVIWSLSPDNSLVSLLPGDTPYAVLQAITELNDDPRLFGPHNVANTHEAESCIHISRTASWSALHEVFARYNIENCFSYPIKDNLGQLSGVLSLYNLNINPSSETDAELLDCVLSALGLIFSQDQLKQRIRLLESARDQEVFKNELASNDANLLLRKALTQRDNVQEQLIDMEKMAALGTMMASFTHEINTPLGVVITAAAHMAEMHKTSYQQFVDKRLKRSDLEELYVQAQESCQIIERNISRANELTQTFKQLAADQRSHTSRPLNLSAYISEVLLSLKPRMKNTRHTFCLDIPSDLTIVSNPGAIGQVLINLIMNSVQHGFFKQNSGRIHIQGKISDPGGSNMALVLVYEDNGRGMNPHTINNMYKPFFTLSSRAGGNGLGMHICYNIMVKILKGTIDCKSTLNQGVRFEMYIPLNEPSLSIPTN